MFLFALLAAATFEEVTTAGKSEVVEKIRVGMSGEGAWTAYSPDRLAIDLKKCLDNLVNISGREVGLFMISGHSDIMGMLQKMNMGLGEYPDLKFMGGYAIMGSRGPESAVFFAGGARDAFLKFYQGAEHSQWKQEFAGSSFGRISYKAA